MNIYYNILTFVLVFLGINLQLFGKTELIKYY